MRERNMFLRVYGSDDVAIKFAILNLLSTVVFEGWIPIESYEAFKEKLNPKAVYGPEGEVIE